MIMWPFKGKFGNISGHIGFIQIKVDISLLKYCGKNSCKVGNQCAATQKWLQCKVVPISCTGLGKINPLCHLPIRLCSFTMATVGLGTSTLWYWVWEGIAFSYWLGAVRTAYRVDDESPVGICPHSLSLPRSSQWLPGSRVCHVCMGVRRGCP